MRLLSWMCAVALLAGCGGSEPIENVALRRLAVAWSAEWPVREYVVRSQPEWAAVFAEVRGIGNPVPPLPAVDFASDAVLGVSLGWWGGCAVPSIRNVTRQGIDYTVEYGTDLWPPVAACTAQMRVATSFVLVPQPVGQVTFVRKDL